MTIADNDTARHPGFVTPAMANLKKNEASYATCELQQQLEKQLRLAMATQSLLEAMLSMTDGKLFNAEVSAAVWRHREELAPLAAANGFWIAEHGVRKDIGMLCIDWNDNGVDTGSAA